MEYLEQKAAMEGKAELSITHQAIATDLGTFREVISRLLKQLEKNRKYLAFPKFFKNFRLCVTFITHFVEDRLYLYTINLFNYQNPQRYEKEHGKYRSHNTRIVSNDYYCIDLHQRYQWHTGTGTWYSDWNIYTYQPGELLPTLPDFRHHYMYQK